MKRRILSMVLTLALVMGLAIPAGAAGTTDENGFTIEDGVLTAYSGAGENITIPESVTKIGDEVFRDNTTITSIVLPPNLTEIGGFALYGCTGLTSVAIPASVTIIKNNALSNCPNLTTITFAPESTLNEIQRFAFSASGLTSLEIPASVTTIAEGVFSGCTALSAIAVAAGSSAFKVENNSLLSADGTQFIHHPFAIGTTSFVIPEGVTSILNGAINAGTVTLPKSLSVVNCMAFSGTKEFVVATDHATLTANSGIVYTTTGEKALVAYPSRKEGMTFVVPGDIKSIGAYAFQNATYLTSITLPEGLLTLETYAFYGASKITEMIVPDSVTSIGASAFANCRKLASIIILGSNVTIANKNAFQNAASDFKVYGIKNSLVHTFCTANNIPFSVYGEPELTPTTVTITQADGVYGVALADAVKSVTDTGTNGAWSILYKGREGSEYAESATKPTEPGKYTVTATYEDDTYKGSNTADFIIDKATATVTATPTGKTYDGTAATVSATNTGDGESYTYAYATSQTGSYTAAVPTDAGTYWVKATVAATSHYKSAESAPISYTITAKDLTGEAVEITGVEPSYTVTGSAIKPVPVVKYNSATLAEGENEDYTLAYEANTAVGESAKVIINFHGNYSGSKSVTFAIVALPVQTVTFTTPTVDASGQVTITGAGTATITATAAEVPNTWAQGTASYTVTVAPTALTITGLTATTRAYDGTKNVPLTGGTLNGILNNDDVTAAMPTNGTVESAEAGSGKAVTVPNITLTGAKKDSYTVTQPSGITVNITKAAAPVVAPVNKSFSCASAHEGETVNLAALLPADRGDANFVVGSITDANSILEGAPTLTSGVLTFSVKVGEAEQTAIIPVNVTGMTNYEDATITVNITLVAKTQLTITGVSVTGKTYDGIAVAPSGTPAAEGYTGDFEHTYSGVEGTVYDSADAPKDAGNYALTVKVPETETEFMGETEAMPFTIEKAALTVKPADKSIYTGDALPTVFELAYTGFVTGEDKSDLTVTGAPEYALKNGKNALENSNTAGTYTIAWANKDGLVITADNYTVTKADGVLTISDRPSSGGGTGGGSTPSKPVTNPDGSTTTTTKNPDGSTTAVTESKDGGKTTETTTKSGTTITATVPADKNAPADVKTVVKAEVKDGAVKAELPAKDVDALIKAATESKAGVITIAPDVKAGADASTVTVSFPAEAAAKLAGTANIAVVTPVGTVTLSSETMAKLGESKEAVSVTLEVKKDAEAPTFTFALKSGDKSVEGITDGVKVTLPAENPTPGTVAVLVLPDGTEQIIRKSYARDNGVLAQLDGSATVKLVDNSKSFADVPAENWAADAVAFASGHDLFQGVSGSDFAPGMTMNRGMLVTVLNRLENEAKGETSASFGDVDGSAYYADAVAWASENGIVTGTGAGFAPDAEISRETLAVMLYRYAGALGYDTSAKADSVGDNVSGWAIDAMSWAVGSGLLQGDGSGNLNPAASATRAETAIILQRFVEGLVE